jgi:hypothetical protein
MNTREDATSTKSLDAYIQNSKINDDLIFDFKFYENTFENLFAIGRRSATHHGIVISGQLKDGITPINRAFDMGLQSIKYNVRILNLTEFWKKIPKFLVPDFSNLIFYRYGLTPAEN